MEAEYIAALVASCQVVWLQGILESLKSKLRSPTIMFCDNSSTIYVAKDLVGMERQSIFEFGWIFIDNLSKKGQYKLNIAGVRISWQIFSQSLSVDKFSRSQLQSLE